MLLGPQPYWLVIPIAAFVSLIVFVSNPSLNNINQVLGNVDDPRFIGCMIQFLLPAEIGAGRGMQKSAQETIIRLLPQLRQEHMADWTEDERKALVLLLSPYGIEKSAEILPAIFTLRIQLLKALEQVGDEREIKVVRKLATMKAVTPKAKELQQAAQECLAYLSVRVEKQQQERMLVRASETPAEQLLRPHDPGATA